MARLRFSLTPRSNRDGIDCPRPEIRLPVKVNALDRTWSPVWFIVDTGADVSVLPVALAEEIGIPFQRAKSPTAISTQAGKIRGHVGSIRVLMDGREYTWRCYFTESLTATEFETKPSRFTAARSVDEWAESQTGQPTRLRHTCLLGRADFLTRDFDLAIRRTEFELRNRDATPWFAKIGWPFGRTN